MKRKIRFTEICTSATSLNSRRLWVLLCLVLGLITLSFSVEANEKQSEQATVSQTVQQRWFDLKRTRKLVDYVKARNAQASPNIKEFHYYRPIPQIQMEACTNIGAKGEEGKFWQNDGY